MPWSTRKPTAIEIAPDWLKPYCEQFLQRLVDRTVIALWLGHESVETKHGRYRPSDTLLSFLEAL